MKKWQFLMIVALVAASTVTFAGNKGYYHSKTHSNCGPKTPPSGGGDSACVVTWDFTETAMGTGDPLTYPGSDSAYTLVVQGFAVRRNSATYGGTIYDRPVEGGTPGPGNTTGDYVTDYDGSNYGIGVHAQGEAYENAYSHWGSKIDNLKTGSEPNYVRDAVLLDFGNCVVSIDQIDLIKVLDTDFELWAYSGTLHPDSPPQDLTQLGDYDGWATDAEFTLVDQNWSKDRSNELDAVINGTPVTSRYFVLIAGGNKNDSNDAFRIAGLQVTCDPNCTPSGAPGVPVPGTLALFAIGALATRRRLRKES